MPPKKKGKVASPVVVGTVSTRSTRRQSVVNIEIPKSKARKRKNSNESVKTSRGSVSLNILGSQEKFSDKIKTAYNKSISAGKGLKSAKIKSLFDIETKISSVQSQKISTRSLKQSSSKPHGKIQSNKALLQILEDWSDGESQDTQRGTPGVDSSDDADSYKNKDFKNLEFGAEDISKIIGQNYTISKSTDSLFQQELSVTSDDIKDIEHTLTSEKDDSRDETSVNENETMEEGNNCEIADRSLTGNMNASRMQGSIEEVLSYESEVVFECVTEEIIPSNMDLTSEGSLEKTPTVTESESSEEGKEIQATLDVPPPCIETDVSDLEQNVLENVIEETRQSISTSDSTDSEVRKFFAKEIEKHESLNEQHISQFNKNSSIEDEEEIKTNINIENTSENLNNIQIVNVGDHCDGLVEGESKQIETTSNEQFVNSSKLEDEEMAKLTESLEITNENQKNNEIEESIEEFIESEEIVATEEIEEMVVEEVVGTQEIEISDEKEITLNAMNNRDFVEEPQEYEQIGDHIDVTSELKNDNLDIENQVFVEKSSQEDLQQIDSEEKIEMTNDSLVEEEKKVVPEKQAINGTSEEVVAKNYNIELGLEKKVAELNIGEDLLENTITEKVAGLHLQVSDEVKDDKNSDATDKVADNLEKSAKKSIKPARTQKAKSTESTIIPKNKKSKVPKPVIPKPVRTLKTQPKNLKEKKPAKPKIKEPKETKLKDKKVSPKSSKDPKAKKKPPPVSPNKKGKDFPEKKSAEILDQKEKKSSKTESDKEKTETDSEDMEVRRSSRIKSISILKKKTTGHGLVRSKSEPQLNESDTSDNNSIIAESEKGTPSVSPKMIVKERKTRWSKSTENLSLESPSMISAVPTHEMGLQLDEKPKLLNKDPVVEARLKQFVHLKENSYKTDRMVCKEAKTMICDCFLTAEEISAKEYGCGEDCLNRLLLIECGNLCQVADRCTNKRFQKVQFAPVEVFNTEKKGLGLRAAANIPFGEFILEYVGEVLDIDEFDKRAEVYSQDKNTHYYFMALRADAIIDATMKGNISRFINHSCDPNAETQKWTVNGELRIGFFSTRTILAGEEITFDYRFQRYGKEAQKCYCGAAICKGWLGEQPDSEEEDEEEDEEEEEEEHIVAPKAEVIPADVKMEIPIPEMPSNLIEGMEKVGIENNSQLVEAKELKVETEEDIKPPLAPEDAILEITSVAPATDIVGTLIKLKKKVQKKKLKPRIEILEEIDQLNEEIELLVTTGLKNQAHTLKLSRLMVRAKEPQQRTKLLRVLRRGELPCRRLFLDYHGLRLMHGYMIDAQVLVMSNKKFESLRLEMLQTLAVLPIPNRTMLRDSKVLPTVEKWASSKDLTSPGDSDSNSPKLEHNISTTAKPEVKVEKEETKNEENVPERSVEDQEEEIRFLANKLLEEWRNLKDVFRIPKKERIEQMKEHEKEANRKFMQSSYAVEHDKERKSDSRYRILSKFKIERDTNRRLPKPGEKYSAEFMKLSKIERRKLFALQQELKEEERRLKQRELWRQHEMNCMMIGTDPRFTAPFDPSKPYQLIWNPQLGQWVTYPLPQNPHLLTPQPQIPNLNIPPPQLAKSMPYQYTPPPMSLAANIGPGIPQLQPNTMSQITTMSALPSGITPTLAHPPGQVQLAPSSIAQMNPINAINSIQSSLHQNLPTHTQSQVQLSPGIQSLHGPMTQNLPPQPQVPPNLPGLSMSSVQYQEQNPKEEEVPSQIKFMGPIPPPVKLPPKWKCAKDKYGRPYYYHIKIRRSQWEPPPLIPEPPEEEPEESSESESSSDTSSTSSDTSSENSESEEEIDDTKLLLAVRRQMETTCKLQGKSIIPENVNTEEPLISTPSPEEEQINMEVEESTSPFQPFASTSTSYADEDVERPSIDIRLKEQFNFKDDKPPKKKRRVGLCEEILIEPRSEEDKLQAKEDLKRYKANKEKLKRQKELILQQTKKQLREIELKKSREKSARTSLKAKMKDMPEFNKEVAKKIKETFRNNMASTVVNTLNNYRKPDCKEGKITNTEDFKHLARKLTHFVMLKEMKHISRIEDLTCTDNVKMKAREYIRKYMSKFGDVYIKRSDSPEFKD